jgi:dihydroorotase
LLDRVPDLRVVMEHITTADAAEFVARAPSNVAATITPQHMLLNRNALFVVRACPAWGSGQAVT